MKVLFISRATLFSQPGGDTLQMEETAKYLRKKGITVDINPENPEIAHYDLIHGFNLIRPAVLLPYLKEKPFVLSSIYHDYAEYDQYHRGLSAKTLYRSCGKFGVEYLKVISRWVNGSDSFPGWKYLLAGHKSSMKKVLQKSRHVFTTSQQEASQIKKDLEQDFNFSIVPLGSEHFTISEPPQKRAGILCAARIEGPKNQLNLIRAVNGTSYTLMLTGNIATNQSDYAQVCKNEAGPNIEFAGRLSDFDLSKAFAAAKVHALPSYYETTGLSTLEALKSGCQAVITGRGAQKELFEGHAFFCDPDSPESIREAIEKAMYSEDDHSNWVKENFSWAKAAKDILDIYKTVLNPTKA